MKGISILEMAECKEVISFCSYNEKLGFKEVANMRFAPWKLYLSKGNK